MAPLTVVQGLPGTGKTTLVADWIRGLGWAAGTTAWFTLTPEHDDPVAIEAVLRPAFGRAALLVVVLDDAHHLGAAAADVVARLIASHPSIHVVACADGEERLLRAARRRHVSSQLIPGAELHLAPEEIALWADGWGHEITPAQGDELHALVGGWITPLQLVLDATPSSATDFLTRDARTYLTGTVLPTITDLDALDDARRLALPGTVTLRTAAALLDANPSGARSVVAADRRIRQLEGVGLLWPEGGDATVRWRFPTLVRRTLAEAYERDHPERSRADHGVIARALRAAGPGSPVAAVLHHARRAEEWTLLSRVWSEESWQVLSDAADEFAIAYADLPAHALRDHPDLHLPSTIADIVARADSEDDPGTRSRFIRRHYLQLGLDYLSTQGQASSPVDRVERLTAAMVALRDQGRVQDALTLAPRIDRELAGLRRQMRWGRRALQSSWFLLEWGMTLVVGGECEAGIGLLARAYESNPAALPGSTASSLLALTHALRGDAAETRRWLARHEATQARDWWDPSRADLPARLARASLALDGLDGATAAIELDLGDPFDAAPATELWPVHLWLGTRLALFHGDPLEMLGRLERIAQLRQPMLAHGQHAAAQAVLGRCRAELMLAIGEVDRVRHLVGERRSRVDWRRILDARQLLMSGEEAQAERTAVAAAWADTLTHRDRAELLMIGAAAAWRRGRQVQAVAIFRRAHALSSQCGTLEPYLTCAPEELSALLDCAGVTFTDEAAAAINSARPPYPAAVAPIDLSPREREVLALMHGHETAGGIARALGVSVNTVRKQQASIYSKLDVHDRASAVLVAEQLGLLPAHGSPATD